VQRHTDPKAVATSETRAGSPVLDAYLAHSAIPAECRPTRQIGDPLSAVSSSVTGRIRKEPNLEIRADAGIW